MYTADLVSNTVLETVKRGCTGETLLLQERPSIGRSVDASLKARVPGPMSQQAMSRSIEIQLGEASVGVVADEVTSISATTLKVPQARSSPR
jgi:hypothetical protein